MFVPNFNCLGKLVAENSFTENLRDGKRNIVQKEDKSKPQHLNLVFSNRFGHSEHAYEI